MSNQPARIWGTLDPFVEPGPIIGRKVANLGFLEALLKADPFDAYHFFLPDQQSARCLQSFLRQLDAATAGRVSIFPRTDLPARLAAGRYHVFHLSDCLTSQGFLAALRNRVARNIFPITGVTHSLSYARYGQAFAQHVWPGVTPRDCIVATSRAGAEVVRQHLASLSEMTPGHVPDIRIIPLGVWCREFEAQERIAGMNLPADRTIFLVLGRVSPYSKMDVLPLLRAFQRLGRQGVGLQNLCLVLAGGTDESGSLGATLRALSANIGLELIVVPEPDEALKKSLLLRADVVVSLADNPQETFGLTILEAAAAGKPVIASDYDGYRDLVLDQQTGLLIPTMDGGVDDLVSLMAPLLYDSTYHLWLAQDVAVDVGNLALAIRHLLDPERRKVLGAAAQARARTLYDWPVVVERYLELWEFLGLQPAPEPGQGGRPSTILDYARLFAGYPSRRLDDEHVLETTELGWAVYRQDDFPVVYAGIDERVDLELMRRILVQARRSITWKKLQGGQPSARMRSTVMWMLKNDYLRFDSLHQASL